METQIYPFDKEYRNEVRRRFNEGGVLYFIERTDTNQVLYEPFFGGNYRNDMPEGFQHDWTNDIKQWHLTYAYLTRGDAERYKPNLTVGGCRSCGNGSILIHTIITEHEFAPSANRIE